jgi:hypothetical protein
MVPVVFLLLCSRILADVAFDGSNQIDPLSSCIIHAQVNGENDYHFKNKSQLPYDHAADIR